MGTAAPLSPAHEAGLRAGEVAAPQKNSGVRDLRARRRARGLQHQILDRTGQPNCFCAGGPVAPPRILQTGDAPQEAEKKCFFGRASAMSFAARTTNSSPSYSELW